MTINVCGKFINTIGSIYQSISKEELIKHLEINIPTEIIIHKKIIKHKKYTNIKTENHQVYENDDNFLDELLENDKPLKKFLQLISKNILYGMLHIKCYKRAPASELDLSNKLK